MSLYLRGKVYYYDIVLAGARYSGSCHSGSRRTAQKYEDGVRAREKARVAQAPGSLTLQDAFTRLDLERWALTKNRKSVLRQADVIQGLLGARTPLASIGSAEVSRLLSALRSRGLQESTINRYKSVLSCMFSVAVKQWQEIPAAPYIKASREPANRLRFFTIQECDSIQHFLRTTPEKAGKAVPIYPEVADLFILLEDTGMRLMEGLTAESRDIDLEANAIRIWKGKTDRPRSVPMTVRVRDMVRPRVDAGPLLFPLLHRRGAAAPWLVENVFRVVRARLGLGADCCCHTFRHTAASRMVQAGVDLYTVSAMLGHSTIRVTERYAHLSQANLVNAVEKLDELRNGKREKGLEDTRSGAGDSVGEPVTKEPDAGP
jgi:integrase